MVITLIQVVAGFVASFDFDDEFEAMFGNDQRVRQRRAAQQAAARRQAFERAHISG